MTLTIPEPRYAEVHGDLIAYYLFGSGRETLVGSPGFFASTHALTESRDVLRLIERVTRFRRLVMFDHRGHGLSDALPDHTDPGIEPWVDDIVAVIDAVGCSRADVFAMGVNVPSAIASAALHPERVASLVLLSGAARLVSDGPGEPGIPLAMSTAWRRAVEGSAESTVVVDVALPTSPESTRRFLRRAGQQGARPRTARRLLDALASTDVTDLLPLVRCPTLVVHGDQDAFTPPLSSVAIAEQVPGARLALLPTSDHIPAITHPDEVAALAEEFLTGTASTVAGRDLLTIVSSDIVDSTATATTVGDAGWRTLMADFSEGTAAVIGEHGGSIVKFTGDGHLATFAHPSAAVTAAKAMQEAAEESGIRLRVGVHTGEVELLDGDVLGVAVVIATRVMSLAAAGDVYATSTVVDLIDGSGHRWSEQGTFALKGVPRERQVWALDRA